MYDDTVTPGVTGHRAQRQQLDLAMALGAVPAQRQAVLGAGQFGVVLVLAELVGCACSAVVLLNRRLPPVSAIAVLLLHAVLDVAHENGLYRPIVVGERWTALQERLQQARPARPERPRLHLVAPAALQLTPLYRYSLYHPKIKYT